jgi:hypothetical protein
LCFNHCLFDCIRWYGCFYSLNTSDD